MSSTRKPTILVVDDESHILHVVSMKLLQAGFRVLTAEDGEEGLEAAREHTPALIITDYQMPFMNGIEMCEMLRKSPKMLKTPILMVTARGSSLSQALLDRLGIVGVLSKPFSPREILARVTALIGQPAPTGHHAKSHA